MYTVIAKFTILPGNEKEAMKAVKALAVRVKKTEPDTLTYLVHTPDFKQESYPTPQAGELLFYEIYKNKAAFEAHVNGPNFKNFMASYGHLFQQTAANEPFIQSEVLKREAGFLREEAN